jgi:AraC-like DNA-binding protein
MSGHDAPRAELRPGDRISRHLHARPYATVVLSGGYEEAGEGGRWRVGPGDVLLHGPFSAHWDLAPPRGAKVLNLALPATVRASAALRVADPDLVARLAERDPRAALQLLLEAPLAGPAAAADLPDLLAQALSGRAAPGVAEWSRRHGVSRQTAFRSFRAAYGVGPARYRVEARARRAWRMIVDGSAPLAEVAQAAGFADQAHMCRDLRALTGRTPRAWRGPAAQPSFKTASA